MKLEKFNPFVTARLNVGYSSQSKLAQVIGVSKPTYSQWERGTYASVYEHNLAGFKKMCDIFGWTYEEGLNNLSNLNKWRKDPNVHIVNPTMEQAQAIAKTWKPDLSTLDTSNTDISKEQEMLDNPLKIWRGQKNLTRSEAAKLCHVDVNVYSDCEDGVKKPNGFDLTKILKGTGLGFVGIQKIFRDDTVKNAIENALAAQSKQEISYVEKPEEPKSTYSYVKKPEGTPIDDEPDEENNLVKAINVIKNDVKEVTEKKAEEPKPEEPKVNPKWPQNFIFGCLSIRKDLAISTKDDWVHKELYSWLEAGKDNQYSVTHEGFTLREAEGIELYFKEFGHTFEGVGKLFGVTRERARQIILKAQRKFAYHIHLMLENDERDRKIIQEELTKAEACSNREFTLEIKQDANGCPYTDDTPIEQAKVTARDENGKAVAGRYPWGDPKKIIPGWYTEKTKIEMTDPSISGKLDSISDWLFQISNEVTELKKEKKMTINPEMFTAAEKSLLSHVMEICYGKLEFGEYNRLRSILGHLIEREE